jgi:hypothetical protein
MSDRRSYRFTDNLARYDSSSGVHPARGTQPSITPCNLKDAAYQYDRLLASIEEAFRAQYTSDQSNYFTHGHSIVSPTHRTLCTRIAQLTNSFSGINGIAHGFSPAEIYRVEESLFKARQELIRVEKLDREAMEEVFTAFLSYISRESLQLIKKTHEVELNYIVLNKDLHYLKDLVRHTHVFKSTDSHVNISNCLELMGGMEMGDKEPILDFVQRYTVALSSLLELLDDEDAEQHAASPVTKSQLRSMLNADFDSWPSSTFCYPTLADQHGTWVKPWTVWHLLASITEFFNYYSSVAKTRRYGRIREMFTSTTASKPKPKESGHALSARDSSKPKPAAAQRDKQSNGSKLSKPADGKPKPTDGKSKPAGKAASGKPATSRANSDYKMVPFKPTALDRLAKPEPGDDRDACWYCLIRRAHMRTEGGVWYRSINHSKADCTSSHFILAAYVSDSDDSSDDGQTCFLCEPFSDDTSSTDRGCVFLVTDDDEDIEPDREPDREPELFERGVAFVGDTFNPDLTHEMEAHVADGLVGEVLFDPDDSIVIDSLLMRSTATEAISTGISEIVISAPTTMPQESPLELDYRGALSHNETSSSSSHPPSSGGGGVKRDPPTHYACFYCTIHCTTPIRICVICGENNMPSARSRAPPDRYYPPEDIPVSKKRTSASSVDDRRLSGAKEFKASSENSDARKLFGPTGLPAPKSSSSSSHPPPSGGGGVRPVPRSDEMVIDRSRSPAAVPHTYIRSSPGITQSVPTSAESSASIRSASDLRRKTRHPPEIPSAVPSPMSAVPAAASRLSISPDHLTVAQLDVLRLTPGMEELEAALYIIRKLTKGKKFLHSIGMSKDSD